MDCPYAVLGLNKGASEDDVKKRFRQLAKTTHPDKNGSASDFLRIKEAYDRILDPHDDAPPSIFPDNIFGDFVFTFKTAHARRPVQQHEIEVPLSESDVYYGCKKKTDFEIRERCDGCSGSGDDLSATGLQNVTCPCCLGQGILSLSPFIQMPCALCKTAGTIPQKPKCAVCGGEGAVFRRKAYDIKCPRGVPDGHKSTLAGRGPYNVEVGSNDDLVLVFRYTKFSDRLRTDGKDIHIDLPVHLNEVLNGFKREVLLYREKLEISADAYVNPSVPRRLPGWGLPAFNSNSSAGDVVVHLQVIYPDAWNDGQCEKLTCEKVAADSASQ